MVYLCIFLLITGMFCLLTEAFVPGFGFFGIAGIILMVLSWILTAVFMPFGFIIALLEVVFLGGFVFFLIKYMSRSNSISKLILNDVSESEMKEIEGVENLIGKQGRSKTSLRPFGIVDFNGITAEVYSSNGYINEHEKVKVTEIKDSKIYVSKVTDNLENAN